MVDSLIKTNLLSKDILFSQTSTRTEAKAHFSAVNLSERQVFTANAAMSPHRHLTK